jgi:heat shock protein HtpX
MFFGQQSVKLIDAGNNCRQHRKEWFLMSSLKTFVLMGLLTILLVLAGSALGGHQGAILAFILALAMNMGSYWFSDKIVLKMYRARPIERQEMPQLFDMVQRLAQRAHLPMPRLYLIPLEAPNAFATGRDPKHAAVAVTTGIMQLLNKEELEGVLSHELAHVKNRDILIGTIAATLAGAITMLASMARWAAIFGGIGRDDDNGGGIIGLLAMMILAPIAAMLIQLAVSRSREYKADADGARLSARPLSLANALENLENFTRRIPMRKANPATAHMFIVNPLRGGGVSGLFSTHPPIAERIKRLKQQAALV